MKLPVTIICTICLMACFFTRAQGVKFGLKAGADLHRINGQPFDESFTFGYHAGVFVEIRLNKTFGFQPEIYYSQVSVDSGSAFSDIYNFDQIPSLKFGYVNVPLLFNIRPIKSLTFQVGPQFGLLVSNNFLLASNAENAIKKGEMSLVGGVQVNLLKIRLYGRYVQGISDLNKLGSTDNWTQQTVHLGIGLSF